MYYIHNIYIYIYIYIYTLFIYIHINICILNVYVYYMYSKFTQLTEVIVFRSDLSTQIKKLSSPLTNYKVLDGFVIFFL